MSKKVQSGIYYCIAGIAALIFSSVYLGVLRNSIIQEHLLIPFMAILLIGYALLTKLKSTVQVFRCCFCCMVVVQLFLGYLLMVEYTTWDVCHVVTDARKLVQGTYSNVGYYARYPNNIGIMLLFAGIFSVTDAIWSSTSVYFLVALNILAIDCAVILIVRTVQQLFHNVLAYRVGICLTMFAPLYLFVPICYTDTFVMPFLAGAVYLAVKITKTFSTNSLTKNAAVTVLMGCLVMIGMKLKATMIIALIAAIIYWFFTLKPKAILQALSFVLVGCFLVSLVWTGCIEPISQVTDELLDQHQFPVYHWIMMGLDGKGNYNSSLIEYTQSFPTYAEKSAATINRIVEKISDVGIGGVIQQCYKKAVTYAWNLGTCYAERYIGDYGDPPRLRNVLHEFVLTGGKYHAVLYVVSQSFWLICMGFTAIGMVGNIIRKDYRQFFIHLLPVGCMMFFMIWETHPRYILHYAIFAVAGGVITLDAVTAWCGNQGSQMLRKLKRKSV